MDNYNMVKNFVHGKKMEIIELLRFPLAVLIICIHFEGKELDICLSDYGIFWPLHSDCAVWIRIIGACLSKYGVPVFFIISGFLFYYKVKTFTLSIFQRKLLSRLYTLIIPYIIWNLLRFIIEGSIHGFDNWSVIFIKPANGQMWFIRDLIYMALLSPIICFILKKLGFILPVILFILCSSLDIPYSIHDGFLMPGSVLYYTLGGAMAFNLEKILVLHKFIIFRGISVFIFIIYILISFVTYFNQQDNYFVNILFFVSMPGFVYVLDSLCKVLHIKSRVVRCAEYSFFIYASHKLIGMGFQGVFKVFGLNNIFWSDSFYLCRISIITMSCIVSYLVIKRLAPLMIFNVLTGSRNNK